MVYIYHTDILKCRQKIKHQTITVDSQVKKKPRIIGNMFNMILFRLKKKRSFESTSIPVVFSVN